MMVMRVTNNNDIINKAIIYATKHHEGVCRKGKTYPYIIHPLEVMSIVASITEDKDLICAGALHDLIEDTDVTYEDIKREFNEHIANIVAHESQNLLPGYRKDLSWKEIKELQINNLKNESLEVKIVALGDKLSNMKAIYNDKCRMGDKVWDLFHENDPRLHKWRFEKLVSCFDELKDTLAYLEFKQLVIKTFEGVN